MENEANMSEQQQQILGRAPLAIYIGTIIPFLSMLGGLIW
jgi:hypothetical protein